MNTPRPRQALSSERHHTRADANTARRDVFADARTAKRKLESDVLDVKCVAAAAQLLACGGEDGRAHERRGVVRVWKVSHCGQNDGLPGWDWAVAIRLG